MVPPKIWKTASEPMARECDSCPAEREASIGVESGIELTRGLGAQKTCEGRAIAGSRSGNAKAKKRAFRGYLGAIFKESLLRR